MNYLRLPALCLLSVSFIAGCHKRAHVDLLPLAPPHPDILELARLQKNLRGIEKDLTKFLDENEIFTSSEQARIAAFEDRLDAIQPGDEEVEAEITAARKELTAIEDDHDKLLELTWTM